MNSTDNKYGQHGFTLVMSLIILVILTVLSLSSMQSTRLETAMAGNMRESDLAFQSAEMGLQAGESYLQNNIPSLASFNNASAGLYPDTAVEPDYFAANTWNTALTASNISLTQLSTNPQFIIKYLGTLPKSGSAQFNISGYGGFQPPKPVSYFRITARGFGQTNSAPRLVQSYFGRAF